MVRAHIQFFGTVQGVGFRYTCLSFAQALSLTGWVKNLPDGSVEAVAEGSRDNIEGLITKLKNQFGAFIHEYKIVWVEAKSEFNTFDIAR